jgi:uncharacterized protein YndB with AHSA1/START domain
MTQPYEPGPLAQVWQEGAATLVFVRDLRHPPEQVWSALTDPSRISQWAPYDADRDLGRPGDAVLTMVDGDTRTQLPVVVLTAERPRLLELTWGEDRLRWELAGAGDGTRLTLRHLAGQGRDWLPKLAAGWHICLDVAQRMLAGRPVGVIRGQAALQHGWAELSDRYAAELKPDGDGA